MWLKLCKDVNCRYAERLAQVHYVRRCKMYVHMNSLQRFLHPFLKHTLFIKIYFGCCLGKALFCDCPWPPQGRASLYELQRQARDGRRHGDKVTYPVPTPPGTSPLCDPSKRAPLPGSYLHSSSVWNKSSIMQYSYGLSRSQKPGLQV